jgi:hypothetical protein
MRDASSLEGWAPEPADANELADVVDRAFDYRGDVTVVLRDGSERTGYVFNRERDATPPLLQIFEPGDTTPVSIPYPDIRTIRFSGKDTASGRSYAAWLERRKAGTVQADQ